MLRFIICKYNYNALNINVKIIYLETCLPCIMDIKPPSSALKLFFPLLPSREYCSMTSSTMRRESIPRTVIEIFLPRHW